MVVFVLVGFNKPDKFFILGVLDNILFPNILFPNILFPIFCLLNPTGGIQV